MKYKSLIITLALSVVFSLGAPVFADVGDAQVCTDARNFCTERVCSGSYDPIYFDSCIQDNGCSQHFASPDVGSPQCLGYTDPTNPVNVGTAPGDPPSGSSPAVGDPPSGNNPASGDPPSPTSISFKIENPLRYKSIEGLITAIIKLLIQIGLSIAVLFIVYAGFLFVTAGGNSEKVSQAKQVFLWAVVGTAILLGALVIMSVIQNTIKDVTTI